MHETDANLVERILAGDREAFGNLVRRYQGLVYGLAYHRIGNFADAQDVAQDVFVKAFRCLSRLEQPERFAAWLRAIAANECSGWIRRHRMVTALEGTALSCAEVAPERPEEQERRAEVLHAVDSLPEKSRLVVTLHYLSGLSCREIGESLDMKPNAVAQHLHRARRELKELLMAEIEEGYAMNRLPETFTERVLERVTLCPIEEGKFVTVIGEGDLRGFTMAVGDAEKTLITLYMRQDDLDAVVFGTVDRGAETAKGRAFTSTLNILDAFGIEIKQVVLRLSGPGQCRAAVDLTQGKSEVTVDIRPSDALGLAVRTKTPIYAEEPVVREGGVAEEGVSIPPCDHYDGEAYLLELQSHGQNDLLRDRAYEIGLSPEDMIDTARYHVDKAQGTVKVWLEAIPENETTLKLAEYKLGVEKLFALANGRDQVSGFQRGPKFYKIFYSMLGEDARVRIMPDPSPPQPASGWWNEKTS